MNRDDIGFILSDIKRDMPLHLGGYVEIPHFNFGHLPKNIHEFSTKIDDRFLNKHQSKIEELAHHFPNNPISEWIKTYQLVNYGSTGILAHDNFYNGSLSDVIRSCLASGTDLPLIRGGGGGSRRGYFVNFGQINGADIELGTGGTAGDFSDAGKLYAFGTGTGVAGEYYDRVAADISTAAGNYVIGIYDESGGNPANRLADSGSQASSVAFAWVNVTEFALTTNNVWFIWANDNSSNRLQYMTTGGTAHTASYTKFNALPNPIGTLTSAGTLRGHLKTGHT